MKLSPAEIVSLTSQIVPVRSAWQMPNRFRSSSYAKFVVCKEGMLKSDKKLLQGLLDGVRVALIREIV